MKNLSCIAHMQDNIHHLRTDLRRANLVSTKKSMQMQPGLPLNAAKSHLSMRT